MSVALTCSIVEPREEDSRSAGKRDPSASAEKADLCAFDHDTIENVMGALYSNTWRTGYRLAPVSLRMVCPLHFQSWRGLIALISVTWQTAGDTACSSTHCSNLV